MGTRCLTVLPARNGGETAVLYRQFDGYPDGHGQELAEFLSGFVLVNGINNVSPKIANGPDCLSAQIVAHFKTEVGNFYLMPAGTRNCGEDYIYFVGFEVDKEPTIEVKNRHGESLYSGTASQVLAAISVKQGNE